MSQFDLWLKSCEENGTRLYCLDGSGDTGLYKLQTRHMVGNYEYGDSPVYMTWIHGKRLAATINYQAAYTVWEAYKRKLERRDKCE